MEATIVCWGSKGKMENGKENGSFYSILGLYGDNGEESGQYYLVFRV